MPGTCLYHPGSVPDDWPSAGVVDCIHEASERKTQFFFPTIISCIVVETKLFFDLNNLTFNLAMQGNFLFDLNFAFYVIFFSLAYSRHHLCCPKCFLFCPEAKVYLQTLPRQLQADGSNTHPSVTDPLESFEALKRQDCPCGKGHKTSNIEQLWSLKQREWAWLVLHIIGLCSRNCAQVSSIPGAWLYSRIPLKTTWEEWPFWPHNPDSSQGFLLFLNNQSVQQCFAVISPLLPLFILLWNYML